MKTFVEFAALRKQVEDFSTQSIFVSKKRLSGPAITSTEATSTGIKFVGWTPSNQDATGVPKQSLEGRHVQSAVRINDFSKFITIFSLEANASFVTQILHSTC
jgi:hypothetical protein